MSQLDLMPTIRPGMRYTITYSTPLTSSGTRDTAHSLTWALARLNSEEEALPIQYSCPGISIFEFPLFFAGTGKHTSHVFDVR